MEDLTEPNVVLENRCKKYVIWYRRCLPKGSAAWKQCHIDGNMNDFERTTPEDCRSFLEAHVASIVANKTHQGQTFLNRGHSKGKCDT